MLEGAKDLSPTNPTINKTLSELVKMIMTADCKCCEYNDAVVEVEEKKVKARHEKLCSVLDAPEINQIIHRLRRKLSLAEALMESWSLNLTLIL